MTTLVMDWFHFYASGPNDLGHLLFLSCLFVCVFIVNFNPPFNFWTVRERDFMCHIWHAYSTNDALSNDTKVNDIVTVTLTLMLKIAFSDFGSGDIVFHKHRYFQICCVWFNFMLYTITW